MRRIVGFLLSGLLASCLVSACAGRSVKDRSIWSAACWNLATVTGPEDFVVDSPRAPVRLLVSSRNIDHPSKRDGIYSVLLDRAVKPQAGETLPAERLPLVGRDRCSFHPHGISLVQAAGDDAPDRPWLLYVINHHDEEDASPTAGCGGGAEPGEPFVSVEVFRVQPSRLVFVQRLAAPSILTNANDLVATPNGEIWITNPPPGAFGLLWEVLFSHCSSKVVHFHCAHRDEQSLRCAETPESWSVAWDGGRFVNGIAGVPARKGSAEHLYVASSSGRKIHRLRVTLKRNLEEEKDPSIDLNGGPDNLAWADTSQTALLVAVHPNLRRFFQHSIRHRARSPSQVVQIDLYKSSSPELVFCNDGRLVSGVSTAAYVDGDLILGQVFGSRVLRCRVATGCGPTG